jgi:hypothetical protein
MESAQKPSTEKKKQSRSRNGRQLGLGIVLALGLALSTARGGQDVTVAWDPSTTPGVDGYVLHFGTNSGAYFDFVASGQTTTATALGLLEGVTYYFAATAYTTNGVESDPSVELVYTIPNGGSTNRPPTLAPLNDVTLGVNSDPYTVTLSDVRAGSASESRTLRVTAVSSNPYLVSSPFVTYTSPETSGTLTFASLAGLTGSATITVTVDDGEALNNTITRTFTVTVERETSNGATARTVFLEAESGTLQSPMAVAADSKASNGRFIYSSRSEQGTVTMRFDVAEPDGYMVWCRVLSADSSTDSFYVSVDGGPEEIYRTAPNSWSSQWQWTRMNDENTGAPRVFALGAGAHTLTFRSRESSTLLDAVYVSNDPDFVPLRLALAPVVSPVRGMQISFQSSPGYRYQLQATEDFRSWATIWSTALASSNELFSFVDPTSPASRARFYRVRINSTNEIDALSLALPLDLAIAPSATPIRGMSISFQATAGFQYQIQATEDFHTWVPIWNSPVAIANELLSVVDTASTMRRMRFYRVQINPPSLFASASALTKLFIAPEGGPGQAIRVSFQSVAGRQYQLQATDDFRSWIPIWNSPVTTANQLVNFVDTIATPSGARFYRVLMN